MDPLIAAVRIGLNITLVQNVAPKIHRTFRAVIKSVEDMGNILCPTRHLGASRRVVFIVAPVIIFGGYVAGSQVRYVEFAIRVDIGPANIRVASIGTGIK